MQTSDTTWQAYNDYGGNSLYHVHGRLPARRAGALQGARTRSPTTARCDRRTSASALFTGRRVPDDPLPRGQRLRRRATSAASTRTGAATLLRTTSCSSRAATTSTGRRPSGRAMEAARDAGVNLAFFSGNEGFWKTRWEPSAAGPPPRTARSSSYKDTHFDASARTRSSGPARGATRASRRRPRTSRPRTRSPASRSSSTPARRDITVPYAYRQLRHVAQHRRRPRWRPGRALTPRARHARLRVGRGRRQRLPARRARSGCRRRRSATSRCSPTTAARRAPTAPRRTT